MDNLTTQLILRVLERAPQWVRTDLTAKDDGVRRRAEETLAAMIASALTAGNHTQTTLLKV